METFDHQYAENPGRNSVLESPRFGPVRLDFLHLGSLHPCPYLHDQSAREEVFLTRELPPDLYHDFMDHGFRRSGLMVYRPACPTCDQCRLLRVATVAYRPGKSHRRILKRNDDVRVRIAPPRLSREKFRLYTDYVAQRHSAERPHSPSELRRFLYESPVQTVEFEYRLRDRLIAVGILDLCSRSVSTVYCYFDPSLHSRSLGTYAAIQEILFARRHSIPHYYLGYWVEACPSMSYKSRFKPNEILMSDCTWKAP
jgi:leucyl-tRNA---protein transferase